MATKTKEKTRDAETKPRPRPTALVRAEHGEAPIKLSGSDRKLLEEALRRGEDLREELEKSVTSYGRWLLGNVFGGDARAALDEKSKNPVFRELVRRAGGPTLQISRRMLYVALQVAAHDRRITDQAWRGLDVGRKELLLPLGEDAQIRAAADHVTKWNLTQTSTRHYVQQLLAGRGKKASSRLTLPRVAAQAQKLRLTLGAEASLERFERLAATTPSKERARVTKELAALGEVLAKMLRALR